MNEALILGGGLAGGAAALRLAQDGIPARVLERETAPHHKICGEFLSAGAHRDLARLGIDPARLGAVAIDRIRLIHGERQAEARLPFVAHGVSRKALDEAVLESAAAAGAVIERGVKVGRIDRAEVETSAGTRASRHILLATGKHDVRGAGRITTAGSRDYVGFKMHWRPDARQRAELGSAIELVLFDGGYAGLQHVAPDIVNLCLLVRRERLNEIGGGWHGLLAALMREPHIARRLGDAEALLPRPLTIANHPYGYMYGGLSPTPANIFRLGDQAAVTAPLTGDGMAAALRSAFRAADCLAAGLDAGAYHRHMRRTASGQIRRAMLLQRATELPMIVRAGFGILRSWPGALGMLAAVTRLPERRPI